MLVLDTDHMSLLEWGGRLSNVGGLRAQGTDRPSNPHDRQMHRT
jgi:hypothetical protein